MNNLMITILSLSLSGSIFIAILFLCKPLYRERLSKRWQYYVWLIVIVRLLVPFSFEINLIGNLFNELSQHNVSTVAENETSNLISEGSEANVSIDTDNQTQITSPNIPYRPNTQSTTPHIQASIPEERVPVSYPQINILDILTSYAWLIWIVVAIILFIRKLTIYQSFANYIKAGRVELDSMEDLERFGKIVEQSNVKRMVGIYTNSLVSSPLLIGFIKPYLVLPTTNISESDFRHTILHELTHYKCGDMFYKWLVQLTICLHWFNPFVYLMGREINNACEFSCDESVIKNLDIEGIKAYGNTLLNALGFGGEYKSTLSSVTLSENKKILGERLNMIKNYKKKSRFAVVCAVLLATVLGLGAGVVGVYGIANSATTTINTMNGADEDNIPTISGDFELRIPFIAVGEEVLVGRLSLEPGQTFHATAYADGGSSIFVGVRHVIVAEDDNLLTSIPFPDGNQGWLWQPYSSGNTNVETTIRGNGFLYLFVGSCRFRGIATDLTDVTIRVTMSSASTPNTSTSFAYTNQAKVFSVTRASESRWVVGVDIPHMHTTSRFVPFSPLFIESLVVFPGDVVTFDLLSDAGTPFVGLSSEKFINPAGFSVNVGNTGRIEAIGTEPQYVFVFVNLDNSEPIATSLKGTIAIERSTSHAASRPLDEIPVISGDFEIQIPFIAVGEEVLVGRLNLEQGQVYRKTAFAVQANGIFIGVRSVINPEVSQAVHWDSYFASHAGRAVVHTTTHQGEPFVYLFVGSCPLSVNPTDLTDVTIRLTMLSTSTPPIQNLATPQLEQPTNFIPPLPGGANIMHDFIYGGEEIFGWYGIDDELGITTSQGNTYYQGQLAREVVFYTHYRGGNWMVLRSSDTRSDLVIYIHVNSFESSGRIISLNVVEKE